MAARRQTTRPGVVSVVTINYRGAEDTIACLTALRDQLDWPADRLELICVENASGDDSAARIRAALPGVTLIESPTNSGFAGGCNLGVRHASGEYVAFLNNDARPHPRWLRAAVDAMDRDSTVACVASKVLDWDGDHIDYVDGALTWYGMGYKREVTRPDTGEWEQPKDVLFATGAAMVTRTEVYREVGGLDERFFMFYEDVDLGWRLNLLGHRVRYVPESVAYHRHHVTMKKFGQWRERYLLERNALMALYKNLEDATLARVLAPAMALAIRRTIALGGDDPTVLDLQRTPSSPGGEAGETIEVSKTMLAGPYAVDYLVEQLPSLDGTRAELQARRRRADRDLMPLFRQPMEPAIANERYQAGYDALVAAFEIAEVFSTRRRIVVVTGDTLAKKMAGPGIRALHIAEELSREHDVRLVSTTRTEISSARFACLQSTHEGLRAHEKWCDVFIFQGFTMAKAPWLRNSAKVVVADLYDPMHLEQLEQTRGQDIARRGSDVASTTNALNDQLLRGDFFLCASEKQRHFWLGQMAAVGRLNPRTYDNDSSLQSLIATVPFGLPSTPPRRTRPAIKGVVPGIDPDDKVILWAGGVYNWFDPLTLIRAVDRLRQRRDDVKLFFLGMKHPNPGVPEMRMGWQAQQLAADLGLTDKGVFFNAGWVDYDDRQNYLLDADLGVSTHFEHVETTFAFRTRILDYLWAGLPIVATEGDTFGDLIAAEKLGVAVPDEDVDALVEALDRVLGDPAFAAECRANVARVRERFTWEAALDPLLRFCRAPRHAADTPTARDARGRSASVGSGGVVAPRLLVAPPPASVKGDLGLTQLYFREGGVREVARRAGGRIRRVLRERSSPPPE
jgi:GT2 family glycosyltransferase/glycosyltransferase involved in cell wall biosynthesis